MQRLHLQGGFGEKGRTSIGIDDGKSFVMLDAGILTGATPGNYHPHLARPADEVEALVISHAHEDHIGALCWMLSQGFRGQFFMTPTTRNEMQATLEEYACKEDLVTHPVGDDRIEIFDPGDKIDVASHQIETGHSGHVAGGVWLNVLSGGRRTLYCGDVQPDSRVFSFSDVPESDLVVLDCSYGADETLIGTRVERIVDWIAAHPQGCVLPSPLSGRSIEVLNILQGEFAIAEGMQAPLRAQLESPALLRGAVGQRLSNKLDSARVWQIGSDLPDCPLLTYDGMGMAGPAAAALAQAEELRHPVLLTGHLPDGSPGQRMHKEGSADWLRFPTHPVLSQNAAIWQEAGRPPLLGHSCNQATLLDLKAHLPALDVTARTGDAVQNCELV